MVSIQEPSGVWDTELQREQNDHDRRRRCDPDPRPGAGTTRQAPDNNGQASVPLGLRS